MGRFPECLNGLFSLSKINWKRQIKKRPMIRFLNECKGGCSNFHPRKQNIQLRTKISEAGNVALKFPKYPFLSRKVSDGVGVDGVGAKFPFLLLFCSCPRSRRLRDNREHPPGNVKKTRNCPETKSSEENEKQIEEKRRKRKRKKRGKRQKVKKNKEKWWKKTWRQEKGKQKTKKSTKTQAKCKYDRET